MRCRGVLGLPAIPLPIHLATMKTQNATTPAVSEQSAAAFRATRCQIPAKLGSLTLFEAAEMSDAISNVRVCCQHAFRRETGREMPSHFADRMARGIPPGNLLSLAQAARVLKAWHRSTYGDRLTVPSLSSVQNFLFAINR